MSLADLEPNTVERTLTGTGVINWPTHLGSSGEGGMWVLAVVADDYTFAGELHQEREDRPFEKCHVDTLPVLSLPNVLLDPDPSAGNPYIHCPRCGANSLWDVGNLAPYDQCPACHQKLPNASLAHYQYFPLEERLWPTIDRTSDTVDDAEHSRPFLACVCLGTSSVCWVDEESELAYYHFTRADLTGAGEALVAALEALYGRAVELLTFIDT